LVKAKVCQEIEGRNRNTLRKPLDLILRHGSESSGDSSDDEDSGSGGGGKDSKPKKSGGTIMGPAVNAGDKSARLSPQAAASLSRIARSVGRELSSSANEGEDGRNEHEAFRASLKKSARMRSGIGF